MARVMVMCPKNKVPVPTGFNMDKGSFDSSTMRDNKFTCSSCGQTHTWQKKDAWLEGETAKH